MATYMVELLVLLLTLSVLAAVLVRRRYGYWKRRNIAYLEPTFPLGNNSSFFPKGIFIGTLSRNFYEEFKKMGCRIGGVYLGLTPNLVITDPELAKDIFMKDFSSFMNRGIYKTENHPITVNLFAQEGIEWKNARNKLTPLFTSSKMKNFFETMKGCTEEMVTSLDKYATENTDVDIKNVFECYTINVIGSVVYGIDCNCFKNPNAEFAVMGRSNFEGLSLAYMLKLFLTVTFPNVAHMMGISNITTQVNEFFTKISSDMVEYREENDIRRNDFMQMLIDMKKQGQLTTDDILAQTFLFFVAGFETSSSSGSRTLFELALNPEVQDRLRKEINEYTEKSDGNLTYEAITKMEYLNAVFDETLRKWPPAATLTRTCTKDFTFEGTDITVKNGTPLIIPLLGFQRDPDYFPDPLKWDPERFMNKNVKHTGYFPFGVGPRACIGMRFGQIQAKLGVASVVKNFQISLSPTTETPLELEPDTFMLMTKQKIYLKLKKL